MSTATLVGVEEYPSTSYRPDFDYVDGEFVERNPGQRDHSELQEEILGWFRDRRKTLRLRALPEMCISVVPAASAYQTFMSSGSLRRMSR